MKTNYTVTVNETKEVKEFDNLKEAREWAAQCKRTLEAWGGTVTFTCEKKTTEQVNL